MMKHIVVVFCERAILTNTGKIILSACIAIIAAAFINPTETQIRWNKLEHDFGNVKSGQVVETVFTCYNGDDTLLIENVQTSCGCTVPVWQRTPIMPHDSTVIIINFDTEGKRGKHEKVVAVYTSQGLFELVIKANIQKK